MRHSLPLTPQFYVTAPQSCPYIDGRRERKLFTALQGSGAAALNDKLSKQGFRRSQNVLYRPSCADCTACLSARIRIDGFRSTRSQRRTLARNDHMRREVTSPWATDEQYALFRRYLGARHADGGMADMDIFEFAAMIEETPVRTRVIEYWDDRPAATGGMPVLRAVCLTDVLDDGLSMVYSFYDPDRAGDSLGTQIILDHVRLATESTLPFVYLGYWVPGSPKMGYKAQYSSLEIFKNREWRAIGDPADHADETHPLSVEPIAEQVAQIELPDTGL